MDGHDVILLLLVQVGLILAVSRATGALFRRIGQPQVVGEMVAGIVLGPSLFGWLAPHVHRDLFPPASVSLLNTLSQFGVIFFLFLIGLELDPKLLRSRGKSAFVVSVTSIAFPFVLGAALTVFMFAWGGTFDPGQQRLLPAAVFMGAAMSVTAFPVLARILAERRLHRTELGAVTIACAAVDDVSAWVMLAFVVAIARATGGAGALYTALLSAAYVAVMFFLVRPFLHRLQLVYERQGRLSQTVVAVIFLMVLASAATTEWIGIHAMFGAFLMGFVMPKGTQFVRHLGEKLEDFTVVLLLPIFFAYAGLRTKLGLLSEPGLWGQAALVIAVACLGKFGGSAVAARLTGMGWREASALGVLMNTRGLVELVILTVGLQLGVISETVFTIMVMMALFTTFITTPLLHLVYPARLLAAEAGEAGEVPEAAYRVLIPVADPRSGGPLLRVADVLSGPGTPRAQRVIYALHLARPVEHDAYRAAADLRFGAAGATTPGAPGSAEAKAQESLRPLLSHAGSHGIPVDPITFVTRDAAADIARVARARRASLVLMGFHKPVFSRTILGGTVHRVMTGADTDVAVFVDRGFLGAQRVLVPFRGGPHDVLALELAARFARHAGAAVTVLHVVPPGRAGRPAAAKANGATGNSAAGKGAGGDAPAADEAVRRAFDDPDQPRPVELRVVEDASPVDAVLRVVGDFDLVVVGVGDEWGLETHLFGLRPERIAEASRVSMLLVRAHVERPLPAAPSRGATDAPAGPPVPTGAAG